ncbi:hypothetical protein [Aquimarina celericrescens]|uniref:Uncharacterized protein n=1 Tax=Aquimarina celericrescens TaxID=1964542 RepID=A0ABW5AR05_9FLAO|nr:hypothetical protein [Aquimarina celericrescens]
MLQRILKLEGVEKLNRKKQQKIHGGGWPTNERDCILCGGEWGAPLCRLPIDSVCL